MWVLHVQWMLCASGNLSYSLEALRRVVARGDGNDW
jgi:hypothetical protein